MVSKLPCQCLMEDCHNNLSCDNCTQMGTYKHAITHSEIDWGKPTDTEIAVKAVTTFTLDQLHRIRTEAREAGATDERQRIRAAVEAVVEDYRSVTGSGVKVLRLLDPAKVFAAIDSKEAE